MTITERNIKLKHFITCMKCEIHGRECDDNCPTQYEAGNMGEIIENLEEISKALDQQPSKDCISRQAVLDAIDVKAWEFCDYLINKGRNDEQKPVSHFADNLRECVHEELPSVTPHPKTGHCKDCKWWKDSDGLYRRGGHAESQCPINRREVFEGNGYCYMFEPQESEDKE